MKKRILSGMRPTGKLHLGHLVGALNNWVKFQDKYDCFFMVADWHALMSEYKNPKLLRPVTIDNVIDWLSCGIHPEKATIFIQSMIPEHLELFLILSCITPLGWLERCPTYKEQLKELKTREINNYAFLGYPVLQAADILLYKAQVVPVGEDQLPHLELTRQIAKRFNFLYGHKTFPEPQAELTEIPRLLGLDGRKMSKSYDNYISLSDSSDVINNKFLYMFTDPSRLKKTDAGHPHKCNVFSYYKVFAQGENNRSLEEDCRQARIGCTDCKQRLVDMLSSYLSPIRKKREELVKDKDYILKIISDGTHRAEQVAQNTLVEAKQVLGL